MKLLVFAHTPPPHHGQSYMVKLMLDGFGGDARTSPASHDPIACYHVNAQFSSGMDDIGVVRRGKLLLLFRYCLEAIWYRFRYGVTNFYYVPAPGKRAALYRDWLVMALCRPFFKRIICHWHAVGLGDWLQNEATPWERWITRFLLGRPELGIALAPLSMRDALWFRSKRVELVPNGIPDPCPDFDANVLPQRLSRTRTRKNPQSAIRSPQYKVLFLAHCTREKGVFDTIEAVRLVHEQNPGSIQLTIAGAFLSDDEERKFRDQLAGFPGIVSYAGFVSGSEKDRLLRDHDCFCFPTFYAAEGQPVNLIEAMAYGMNVITTRWRTIPDLLPSENVAFVEIQSPHQIARALLKGMQEENAAALRRHFVEHYTAQSHIRRLLRALDNKR